jgi:hypothetical protein
VSLDRAVAGINFKGETLPGLPLRCGYHIWSKESGLGKTTAALSIMGIIAASLNKDIAVCPIDTFDAGNLESILNYTGMNSVVEVVLSKKGHADSVNQLNLALSKKGYCASLLDSAYAVMSTAVEEGEVEDANMGRDAKMVSTYVRQAKGIIDAATEDKAFFITNMSFVDIGARRAFGPPPYVPARGRTLMGLTSIHINLTQAYVSNKAVRFDKGRLLNGRIEKNNFGPTLREFEVFTIGGIGIHKGLTAVYDCLSYGLATINRGKVNIFGEDVASPQEMLDDYNNHDLFVNFFKALNDNYDDIMAGTLKQVSKKKPAKKVVVDDSDTEDEDDFVVDTDGQSPEELMNG